MFKVGVTGGIGSGKTTVCQVFAVLGVPIFNSDAEGRILLEHDLAIGAALQEAFGPSVLVNGVPDRKALAALVFNNTKALARLNGIIHPAVRARFKAWAAGQQVPYVINEAAIMVETGLNRQVDHLVVVLCPEMERIRRVVQRDGRTEAEVRARMRNQATDEERERAADSILVNDGKTLIIPQVMALHGKLSRLVLP